MNLARLLYATVLSILFAAVPTLADPVLFPHINQTQRLEYEANYGSPLDGPASYSVFYQFSAPQTVGVGMKAMLIGPGFGDASITNYTPLVGDAVPVGNAYSPAQSDLVRDLVIIGMHLVDGQASLVVEGGKTFVVADFEQQPGSQVWVGQEGSDLWLHYGPSLAFGPTAMRIWGEQGTSTGFIQMFFDIDQAGAVPSDPASAHGLSLPSDTRVYLDGRITLGSHMIGESPEPWTFSLDLFNGDFGAWSDGGVGGWSEVPEPATLALLALGGAGLAVMRRRRKGVTSYLCGKEKGSRAICRNGPKGASQK